MPINLGQLGGLITNETPSRGASGVGLQVADAFRQQRNDRWNQGFQKRQFDDRTSRLDAEEQRALVAGINEHMDAARNGDPSQQSFHLAQAQAYAYELKSKYGIDYSIDPEDAPEPAVAPSVGEAPPVEAGPSASGSRGLFKETPDGKPPPEWEALAKEIAPILQGYLDGGAIPSSVDVAKVQFKVPEASGGGEKYVPPPDFEGYGGDVQTLPAWVGDAVGPNAFKNLPADLQAASDENDRYLADALKTLDGPLGEGSRAAELGGILGGALRGLPGFDAPTPFDSEPYAGTRTGDAGADTESWSALAPSATLAGIASSVASKSPAPSGGAAMPPGGAGGLSGPPKRRRYTLTDREGRVIAEGDLSPDPELQGRAGGAIGSLSDREADPEKRAILSAATAMADKLSGWMSPEDAYKEAMRWAEGAMGDVGKTQRASLAGGGAKPKAGGLPTYAGVADELSNKNLSDDFIRYIESWEKTRGIPKLNESLAGAERILNMEQQALRDVGSHGSMITLNALKEQVRGVASDADMARFYDVNALESINQQINFLFGSGRVTREAVSRIFSQFRLLHQSAIARRNKLMEEAGVIAEDFVDFRGQPLTRESAATLARQRVAPRKATPPKPAIEAEVDEILGE